MVSAPVGPGRTTSQNARRTTGGPYDSASAPDDFAATRMDFGSLFMKVPDGATARAEHRPSERWPGVHVVLRNGVYLRVHVLAAPRSKSLWDQLVIEITGSVDTAIARSTHEQGPWGAEVVVSTSQVVTRFVGVDGPRWTCYGVVSGPLERDAELSAALHSLMRDMVVVRGNEPWPANATLPLANPAAADGSDSDGKIASPIGSALAAAEAAEEHDHDHDDEHEHDHDASPERSGPVGAPPGTPAISGTVPQQPARHAAPGGATRGFAPAPRAPQPPRFGPPPGAQQFGSPPPRPPQTYQQPPAAQMPWGAPVPSAPPPRSTSTGSGRSIGKLSAPRPAEPPPTAPVPTSAGRPESRQSPRQRLVVLEAVAVAVHRYRELLPLIAHADTPSVAVATIRSFLGVDDASARAILELPWLQLTASRRQAIVAERDELRARLHASDWNWS